MATLAPQPKQQYFDNAGNPLVGGQLYTFAAGTSVPKAVFTTPDETTAHPNPTVLDARGEAAIFWKGAYKVALRSAVGVLLWTVDNVSPGASGGTSGTTGDVDVKTFGAVGDGVTDDTAALQAAADAIRAAQEASLVNGRAVRGTLRFPEGIYRVGGVTDLYGFVNIVGVGAPNQGGTTIVQTVDQSVFRFIADNFSARASSANVQGITFAVNGGLVMLEPILSFPAVGVNSTVVHERRNVRIHDCTFGFKHSSFAQLQGQGRAIQIDNAEGVSITGCGFYLPPPTAGIGQITLGDSLRGVSGVRIQGNVHESSSAFARLKNTVHEYVAPGSGSITVRPQRSVISGNDIAGCQEAAIQLGALPSNNANNTSVTGNVFTACVGGVLCVRSTDDLHVAGNSHFDAKGFAHEFAAGTYNGLVVRGEVVEFAPSYTSTTSVIKSALATLVSPVIETVSVYAPGAAANVVTSIIDAAAAGSAMTTRPVFRGHTINGVARQTQYVPLVPGVEIATTFLAVGVAAPTVSLFGFLMPSLSSAVTFNVDFHLRAFKATVNAAQRSGTLAVTLLRTRTTGAVTMFQAPTSGTDDEGGVGGLVGLTLVLGSSTSPFDLQALIAVSGGITNPADFTLTTRIRDISATPALLSFVRSAT